MNNVFQFPKSGPAKAEALPNRPDVPEGTVRIFYLPYVAIAFCKAVQDGDREKAEELFSKLEYAVTALDDELYMEDLPWFEEYLGSLNELKVLYYNARGNSND